MRVRLGEQADDAAIRALLRRVPMPGRVAIAFEREPSFFKAIEVEGYNPRVVLIEEAGRVAGVGLLSGKRVYVNGVATEVGTLSSLRLDPSIRGLGGLARGYRLLERVHRREGRVPFYLTTILESNRSARELLTSGRAGLPTYRELCRYETAAISVARRRPPPGSQGDFHIVGGAQAGATAIAAGLQRLGPDRQFYPVYTATDLAAPDGLLRGLTAADFHVALEGDAIVGITACWDQASFRQSVVTGYTGLLRWVRGALPRPGEPIRSAYAACVAVEGSREDLFDALLRRTLEDAAGRGKRYLLVGMAADDPLRAVVRRFAHRTLKSRLYAVSWGDAERIESLDDRRVYLEAGSL